MFAEINKGKMKNEGEGKKKRKKKGRGERKEKREKRKEKKRKIYICIEKSATMPAYLLAWARMPTGGQNAKIPPSLKSLVVLKKKKNFHQTCTGYRHRHRHRHRPHPSTRHRRRQKNRLCRVKFLDPTLRTARRRQNHHRHHYRHRHRPHPSPRHRRPPSLSLATFAMAIVEAFKATYVEPMLPVEVEGLEPQGRQ